MDETNSTETATEACIAPAPVRRLMRKPAVREATGLSDMSLYRNVADGKFPAPIALTDDPTGPVAWFADEIADWQASRPRRAYKAPAAEGESK